MKPNKDEIEMLFQTKVERIEDVVECAEKLYGMGISYVVISLGGDGALLVCEEGIFQAKPPKIEAVNTVGCGDSMVGGFAAAFARGYHAEEALKYAAATATAAAMSPNTGDFDIEVQKELLDKTTVIR